MDLRTAETVLAEPPNAFTHFNEIRSHSALKGKSPRMYRRELAGRALENHTNQPLDRVQLYGDNIARRLTHLVSGKSCRGLAKLDGLFDFERLRLLLEIPRSKDI